MPLHIKFHITISNMISKCLAISGNFRNFILINLKLIYIFQINLLFQCFIPPLVSKGQNISQHKRIIRHSIMLPRCTTLELNRSQSQLISLAMSAMLHFVLWAPRARCYKSAVRDYLLGIHVDYARSNTEVFSYYYPYNKNSAQQTLEIEKVLFIICPKETFAPNANIHSTTPFPRSLIQHCHTCL